MMKIRLLSSVILLNCAGLLAQDTTLITVKAGNRIGEVLTINEIFIQPQFITGNVYFRNGSKAIAKMNYNSLTDQMLFIDAKGDTLALTDEKTIKFISLDKDTFYFDEGYMRLVTSNSVARLTEKRVWEVADIRKIGSHDRPSTTYAVTSYSTLTDELGHTRDLVLREDVVLRKKPEYYFGDMFNHFTPATKKNLLLLFPKKRASLNAYFNDNKVNFYNKADLEKIVQFLVESD